MEGCLGNADATPPTAESPEPRTVTVSMAPSPATLLLLFIFISPQVSDPQALGFMPQDSVPLLGHFHTAIWRHHVGRSRQRQRQITLRLCLQQSCAVAAAASNTPADVSMHVKVDRAAGVRGAQPLQVSHQPLDGLHGGHTQAAGRQADRQGCDSPSYRGEVVEPPMHERQHGRQGQQGALQHTDTRTHHLLPSTDDNYCSRCIIRTTSLPISYG